MAQVWLTNGTPTMPGIQNTLMAACDQGYVPDQAKILSNPGVADSVRKASEMFEVIIDAYDGDPDVSQHNLNDETEFGAIAEFYKSEIQTAQGNGDTVAVDFTPGRKFMSAIAFQAGIRYDADHLFYFHRKSGGFDNMFYPEVPRTATDLIDFTEVI